MESDKATSLQRQILTALIAAVFVLYGFRLLYLQVIISDDLDMQSARNSIKKIEKTPLRGVFYDRNMKLLVENIPAYTVRILPSEYDTTMNPILERVLGLDPGTIATMLQKNSKYSQFIPLKIKRGASFDGVGWVSENIEKLPGVDYIIEFQRGYPAGVMGSHIFGYSKEVGPEKLKVDSFYNPGDLIGFSGIERSYEEKIRGLKGYDYILVDSRRREMGRFRDGAMDYESIKGEDLVLSIDQTLQKIAETELKGFRGAVVAIEPSTGEVLAMASSPDFDLNQFSYSTSREYFQDITQDKAAPMFNRATKSAYPPGSTFKILCALAALDLGIIKENTTIYCGGSYTFGRTFKCHGAHGAVNAIHAIEHSCNVFFYQLIFKIGLDRLADYALRYGLGHRTGLDIAEELPGLIPTEAYYEKRYGKNWPKGILVSLGIGQGEISVTPLQLAHFTALVANGGKGFPPHLVKGYLDENKKYHPINFDPIDTKVNQEALNVVKKGMFLVVQGNGTARRIRLPEIEIAGKTGTSQNPHGRDHAFFIAFAPFDKPKIAISVIVENSGFGATYAAPIAQKVIKAYLLGEESVKDVIIPRENAAEGNEEELHED